MKWISFLAFIFFTQVSTAQNDTLFYYSNGDTSVHFLPWKNGVRKIQLYDLKGEKTFTLEEVRLSYTVSNDIELYKNGGVKRIVQKSFSGGSPNWSEVIIYFSSTNHPHYKKVLQYKRTFSNLPEVSKYFWDDKHQIWKKQEVISCDPIKE